MFFAHESMTPTDWTEDATAQIQRDNLAIGDPDSVRRRLYPFRARLLKRCGMIMKDEGTIFQYARVKGELSLYPIEVWVALQGGKTRKLSYNSDEAELLVVAEG